MSNIQKVLNLAQAGNKSAQDLLKLTYSELVLADLHYQIADKMQSLSNALGVNVRDEKRRLKAIVKNAKEINLQVVKELGTDSISERFGDRAESLQSLIMDSVFLSDDDILKLHSTAKIMMK